MIQNNKIKVITIVGTRPEVIRLSRIINLLDKYTCHILVHTGQNYDYELNEIFFSDLSIRKPNYYFNINNTSVGKAFGEIIIKTEELLVKEKPNAVLILGDTNSSISAIIAKRMHIPIYHMEAGNRCFDMNVPEEINRKIVDHVSDFNLVYTEHARRNLIFEGLHPRRIILTGSPMFEVIEHYKNKIDKSNILMEVGVKPNEYLLVSTHREENIDKLQNLVSIIKNLNYLAEYFNLPIVVSTHPRTRNSLEKIKDIRLNSLIQFFKPFSFLDYLHLQKNSFCTISDSGTISEESSILSFPAITIRNSIERPEAIDAGTISMTGHDIDSIISSIVFSTNKHSQDIKSYPLEYRIKDTAHRVVRLILGTHHLSNQWDNIL